MWGGRGGIPLPPPMWGACTQKKALAEQKVGGVNMVIFFLDFSISVVLSNVKKAAFRQSTRMTTQLFISEHHFGVSLCGKTSGKPRSLLNWTQEKNHDGLEKR